MAALKTVISGFSTNISAELSRALRLLDMAKEMGGHSTLAGPLCVEAANAIIYSHNILQSMTGKGEKTPEMPEGTKLNRRMTDDATLKYLHQEITFVIGAINDPFLHSSHEEYQTGAVLNIFKAHDVLAGRLDWFKTDNMFRVP